VVFIVLALKGFRNTSDTTLGGSIRIQYIEEDIKNMEKRICQRIERLEGILDYHDKNHWPRFEESLRQIEILKVRLQDLNEKVRSESLESYRRNGGTKSAI